MVLIFLILGVFLKSNIEKIFPPKKAAVFSSLSKTSVKEINFIHNGKTISVIQKNNQWLINQNKIVYKANQERIDKILDGLTNLNTDEIVSTNVKRQPELGIGPDKIIIKTESGQYELFIGKPSTPRTNYLKINNGRNIFVAAGFDDVFTPDDYRDLKTYLINDQGEITAIDIDEGNTTLKLARDKDRWKINGKAVKKDRVDFFINELATLKTNDIIFDKTLKDGLTTPQLTIKIAEKGKKKTADFYFKDEENYYLTVDNQPSLFVVAAAYVNSLKKPETDFTE